MSRCVVDLGGLNVLGEHPQKMLGGKSVLGSGRVVPTFTRILRGPGTKLGTEFPKLITEKPQSPSIDKNFLPLSYRTNG